MNLIKSTSKRTPFHRGISLREYLRKSVQIEELTLFKSNETLEDQNLYGVEIGDDFIIRQGRSDSPRKEQHNREVGNYMGSLPVVGVKIKDQRQMKFKHLPTDRNSTDASLADPFKPIPNFDFFDNPAPTRFKSRNLSSLQEPTPPKSTCLKSRSFSNRQYLELTRKNVYVHSRGKSEGRVVSTPKIYSRFA